jgi:hypothetical protein
MFANAVRPAAGVIHSGVVGPSYQVPNDDISGVFTVTTGWVWDDTLGYYRNVTDWGSPAIDIPIPNIADVAAISATIHGYYHTPSGSLGTSTIEISMDDGSQEYIGTSDSWSASRQGQTIYKGDDGIEIKVPRDVIGETFTYTIPPGRYVVSIGIKSYALSGYSPSKRGIRDISVTYRG